MDREVLEWGNISFVLFGQALYPGISVVPKIKMPEAIKQTLPASGEAKVRAREYERRIALRPKHIAFKGSFIYSFTKARCIS